MGAETWDRARQCIVPRNYLTREWQEGVGAGNAITERDRVPFRFAILLCVDTPDAFGEGRDGGCVQEVFSSVVHSFDWKAALEYSIFEHVSTKILDENAVCFMEIFPTECGMTLQDHATVTSVLHYLKQNNPSSPLLPFP